MNKKILKDLKKSIQQMKDIKSGKIKARRTWVINPRTRIKESKKGYCRKLSKKEINEIMRSEDF